MNWMKHIAKLCRNVFEYWYWAHDRDSFKCSGILSKGNPFPEYRSISKTEQKHDKASSSLLSKEIRGGNEKLTPTAGSFRGFECFQLLTLFWRIDNFDNFWKSKHRSRFIFLGNKRHWYLWPKMHCGCLFGGTWFPVFDFWRHLVPKLDFRHLKERGFSFTGKGHTLAKPQNISTPFI